MKATTIVRLGILLVVPTVASLSQLHGQSSSIVLTNAGVRGADFSFEILASDLSGCVVQGAPALSGGWTDLPQPVQNPFVVRVDQAERFFRVRCGDSYSVNTAGYLERILPAGWSMIGNPFDAATNTVALLLPDPPPRTALYTFDGRQQVWKNVNVFEFGAWTQPAETLLPGRGAMIETPYAFRQVFGGLVNSPQGPASFDGGWNLAGMPFEFTSPGGPADGDSVIVLRPDSGVYLVMDFDYGAWSEEPVIAWGEGFWYRRNKPNPTALTPEGTVNFNNYLADESEPFALNGTLLEGTNWVAQLYASATQTGSFQPIGAPLPFLTGPGAGYFDTRTGALRVIPVTAPMATVWVQAMMWDRAAGATYEEALTNGAAHGSSEVATVVAGGVVNGFPPVVPAKIGFALHRTRLDGNYASPSRLAVFTGSRATFSCPATGGSAYRWQKQGADTNWVDVPGATTRQLVLDPALPQEAGAYRPVVDDNPGDPGELQVLAAPQFSRLAYEPVSGAFRFELAAPAGFNYRIEASADFTNWLHQTSIQSFDGSQQVTDSQAGSFRQRFYRVVIAGP